MSQQSMPYDMTFDDDISICCPRCNKGILIEANQIGMMVTCPHCGVFLEPQDGEELADANVPRDFEDTFDYFGRG